MSGGLNDITLTQLNYVWFAFAAVAWFLAFATTRWIMRSHRHSSGEQGAAPNRYPAVS